MLLALLVAAVLVLGRCSGLSQAAMLPAPLAPLCTPFNQLPLASPPFVCTPTLTGRKAPPGAMYSIGHKFQLNGVMVATSEPALWGYPQQAGDLMQAVG